MNNICAECSYICTVPKKGVEPTEHSDKTYYFFCTLKRISKSTPIYSFESDIAVANKRNGIFQTFYGNICSGFKSPDYQVDYVKADFLVTPSPYNTG